MTSDSQLLTPALAAHQPLIRAEALSVRRGGDLVLDGADLALAPGESVAIQGRSGAGKSTLLAVLSGLILPVEGAVWFAGERLDRQPDRRRSATRLRDMGLVFQGDELLPELTLAENISLPIRLTRKPRRTSHYEAQIAPLARALGIDGLLNRMPSEVSGGQLQRAAVARSVVHHPRVVLADEPTASLDEVSARDALRLLIELNRETGTAAVVVTHDDDVAAWCDRRLLLQDGVLITHASASPVR